MKPAEIIDAIKHENFSFYAHRKNRTVVRQMVRDGYLKYRRGVMFDTYEITEKGEALWAEALP